MYAKKSDIALEELEEFGSIFRARVWFTLSVSSSIRYPRFLAEIVVWLGWGPSRWRLFFFSSSQLQSENKIIFVNDSDRFEKEEAWEM